MMFRGRWGLSSPSALGARPPSSILSTPLGSADSANPGVGLPRLSDLSQVSPGNGNGSGGAKSHHLSYSEEPMSPNGERASERASERIKSEY